MLCDRLLLLFRVLVGGESKKKKKKHSVSYYGAIKKNYTQAKNEKRCRNYDA